MGTSSPKGTTILWTGTSIAIVTILIATYLRPRPVVGSPEFTFDPNFGLPIPPYQDSPYHRTRNIVSISVLVSCGLIAVGMGARDAYRTKSLLALMLPLSSLTIATQEFAIDHLGGLIYPWSPDNPSFHIGGREVVPWLSVWFGISQFLQFGFYLLENNYKTKALWIWLALAVLSDIVIEEIVLPLGIWRYYGNQPLKVGNFPLWWTVCNSLGVFLAVSIAFRYKQQLKGWKSLVVFITTPISMCGTYGFIAVPSWIAINDDLPWLVTQLLGLLTMALGIGMFCIILDVLLLRNPFNLESRAPVAENEAVEESERYHD